jgi:hypothetical protein
MTSLMALSESFASFEMARAATISTETKLAEFSKIMKDNEPLFENPSPEVEQRLQGKIPAIFMPFRNDLARMLASSGQPVDQALLDAGEATTGAQMVRMIEIEHELLTQQVRERAEFLQQAEQELRDILRLIVNATDEDE